MRVTEVRYMRRNNLGNYEHEEISMSAVIEEDEDHMDAVAGLRQDVVAALSGEKAATVEAPEAEEEKKPAKTGKGKKAPKVEEQPEEEEPEAEDDDEKTADPEEEETEEEPEEEPEEEEKPAPAKGGKKFKKKPQSYSRASEQHKEIFSSVVKSIAPEWKKSDDLKKKAKDASQSMEGKDFLDDSGEVLSEFKDAVKKLLTGKKK